MPPLCLHLYIASEAARRLRSPLLERNQGFYLLGATLPDIHLVYGGARQDTHFVNLSAEGVEGGVSAFFQSHPELAKDEDPDEATKAAVCGYLSHLFTDEVWVAQVYLPFFGSSSPLGDNPMANVYDRAFQFELDRQVRLGKGRIAKFRSLLYSVNWESVRQLAEPSRLSKWQEFIGTILDRKPSWESFAHYARNFLLAHQKVEPEQLESFLSSLPTMQQKIVQLVPPERVESFKEKSICGSLDLAQEYLD